jgi:hypothetical protein
VPSHGTDLDVLTIGAIFLVVFTAMWGGVQHSRGELLPAEEVDARERQVRDALWTEVTEWRTARGLDPPRRVGDITRSAQSAAVAVAASNRSSGGTNETGPPATGPHLTGSDRCDDLLIRQSVASHGWATDPSEPVDPAVADAIATDLLEALAAADDAALLERAGTFRTGIGVAAHGDDLYVVYRSCARRRLP